MPLRAGDVVRLFDGTTAPPKEKRFLCVCATEGWFLRINSRPHWRPNLRLPHTGNETCLSHDSFLELRGIIEYDALEIEGSLREPANHLGQLSLQTIRDLIAHLPTVKTLPATERDTIIAELAALL
jgi:hypothetical protein